MQAVIRLTDGDVLAQSFIGTTPHGEYRCPGNAARKEFLACAAAYDLAARYDRQSELYAIGRRLYDWLDQAGWASEWLRGGGPRGLEIRVEHADDPLAGALLDAPWELLAGPSGYLADDGVQPYLLSRRIGALPDGTPTPWPPQRRDLHLLFMAAAPQDVAELAFEAEEAAIARATAGLALQLQVEESGSAGGLGRRLREEGMCEALHLSCHGEIDARHGAWLALEDDYGRLQPTDAGQLVAALGDAGQVPLLFLSACRSAETWPADGRTTLVESLSRALVRAGVANVVGWDGSVGDQDAIDYAEAFYAQLAQHQSTVLAAAVARRALRQAQLADAQRGRHWHLARLTLGVDGGGALTSAAQPRSRRRHLASSEFLDRERGQSPVASPAAFVGRRRALQHILRQLQQPGEGQAGVLIHGMGMLGKSSLAARVASRCRQRSVVLYGRYDAATIFDRLLAAVPGERRAALRHWRQELLERPAVLGDVLAELLAGPFAAQPILLIVDDLERLLEEPRADGRPVGVKPAARAVVGALLEAFRQARAEQSESRLLCTSRYRFTLPAAGGDLAETLTPCPLTPMNDGERAKQFAAAQRLQQTPTHPNAAAAGFAAQRQRLLAVAAGNPGLQSLLSRPLLNGENAALADALAAIEHYQRHGRPPAAIESRLAASEDDERHNDPHNAPLLFFRRMAFASYRAALDEAQTQQLRAAAVFAENLPIPRPALLAAGGALGVARPEAALDRLLALGLLDDWRQIADVAHAAANPLARPLVAALSAEETARLADAVLPALVDAWQTPEGRFAWDERAGEVARLALCAERCPPAWLDAAAVAAGRYWFNERHDARRASAQCIAPALARLADAASSELRLIAIDCAERLGDSAALDDQLEKLLAREKDDDLRGGALLQLARRQQRRGELVAAETAYRQAAQRFAASDHPREAAIALGGLADIHQARGELDEALRLRREEALPVYERLNDVRSRAATLGQIADIHQARGELDEALRLHREEALPVYERLNDVRSRAVTLGKIADIHQARGELDEALRLRREEALPVFERLGDVRSRAVTLGKIADIHQARGELDEALRLHREEALPVYERLGDVRERALTLGQIADIHQARGELDEALRLHREEALPVFERLGDVRSRAVTLGKIADIHQARGELDEALRLHREEELPVYERLGDVRERALTLGQIADIHQARGELDEALRLHREEELPVYERLGDVRERALTLGQIADIHQARGELDEALRLHREEALPVYERLNDVRSRAVTLGQIADIHQARGELDEALRLRREEALPVYERLGDVRLRAVTLGKIADIHEARGELDEALRLRREEALPVYERLGDVRSRAITLGQIADIHEARGELDEALRLRREEELPVYERLGDVRSRAVTLGQIADIHQARGEVDAALALYDECLAIVERLGVAAEIAHALYRRAAIRLRQPENSPVDRQEIGADLARAYRITLRLGRPDGIGAVGVLYAQVLALGDSRDEALAVLEQAGAAYAKLGHAQGSDSVRQLRQLIIERSSA